MPARLASANDRWIDCCCRPPAGPSGTPSGPTVAAAIFDRESPDSGESSEWVFMALNESSSTHAFVSSVTGSTLRSSDRAARSAVMDPAEAAAIESTTTRSSPRAFAATRRAASAPPS